jgi:hypothetical protein
VKAELLRPKTFGARHLEQRRGEKLVKLAYRVRKPAVGLPSLAVTIGERVLALGVDVASRLRPSVKRLERATVPINALVRQLRPTGIAAK